jgi:hypothetical protein
LAPAGQFWIDMTDTPEGPKMRKRAAAITNALERSARTFGPRSQFPNKNNRPAYNAAWARDLEMIAQQDRGHEFTYDVVKRVLTRNITLKGYIGTSNTRPNTGEPFREIWWNPVNISNDAAAPRYATTTTTELAHEFCHAATGRRGGNDNERKVCVFENMIRFEKRLVMRQEYVDGVWVADAQVPLISSDLQYRFPVG